MSGGFRTARRAFLSRFTNRPPKKSPRQALAKPIFLVGTFRSGTTLLAQILDHSPEIAYCPFELKDIWSSAGGVEMASPKTRDLCCRELHASHADAVNRAALVAAFEQRVALCKDKLPSARFLNKNPHLCNKLPLVNSLFPSAHYIWVHRGLLQVVASIRRLFEEIHQRRNMWHWWPLERDGVENRCWSALFEQGSNKAIDPDRVFPGGNVKYIAEYWIESNRAVHDFYRRNKSVNAVTVVSEEQLLATPEDELDRICRELGISTDFPRQMFSSLNSSRNDAWKSLLSPKEITNLKQLIHERRDEIDSLFPDPKASNWIGEIESLQQAI